MPAPLAARISIALLALTVACRPAPAAQTRGDSARTDTARSARAGAMAASTRDTPTPDMPTQVAITEADLRHRVGVFADDSMAGRAAATAGHARAVRYLVAELTRLGLTPAGDVRGGVTNFEQRVMLGRAGTDTLWSSNVVAIVPGRDARLRGEYVALGAHSDHIGTAPRGIDHDSARAVHRAEWAARGRRAGAPALSGDAARRIASDTAVWRHSGPTRRDSVYNGADDDGSGSMALLELAERFAAEPPARSLLFVWHTGEELGLDGSRWFVAHPTVPLDRIITQLNIDMIGRGSARDLAAGSDAYLAVVGPRRLSKALDSLVRRVNAASAQPLALDYALDADAHPENIYCRSDHASYAGFGIPVAFFFTNLHEDYHEVTDEASYLDYPHYARVVAYIGRLAAQLADLPTRPRVDRRVTDPRAPCRQ